MKPRLLQHNNIQELINMNQFAPSICLIHTLSCGVDN
jgi:hypothetical protein